MDTDWDWILYETNESKQASKQQARKVQGVVSDNKNNESINILSKFFNAELHYHYKL